MAEDEAVNPNEPNDPTPEQDAAPDAAAQGGAPRDPAPHDAADAGDDEFTDALRGAQEAVRELSSEVGAAAGGDGPAADHAEQAGGFSLADFAAAVEAERLPENIDLLSDVQLDVKIELGRTTMLVEDVLRLGEGCVVELDKLAGDPVDIYVNNRHIARGEVLVLNDNFCVRINEIISQAIPDAPAPAEAHPAA